MVLLLQKNWKRNVYHIISFPLVGLQSMCPRLQLGRRTVGGHGSLLASQVDLVGGDHGGLEASHGSLCVGHGGLDACHDSLYAGRP